jgi:hypothetical protein
VALGGWSWANSVKHVFGDIPTWCGLSRLVVFESVLVLLVLFPLLRRWRQWKQHPWLWKTIALSKTLGQHRYTSGGDNPAKPSQSLCWATSFKKGAIIYVYMRYNKIHAYLISNCLRVASSSSVGVVASLFGLGVSCWLQTALPSLALSSPPDNLIGQPRPPRPPPVPRLQTTDHSFTPSPHSPTITTPSPPPLLPSSSHSSLPRTIRLFYQGWWEGRQTFVEIIIHSTVRRLLPVRSFHDVSGDIATWCG